MNLRSIPPPVLLSLSLISDNGNWQCTRAWDSDDHVFYLISYLPHIMLWAHEKVRGIGGRIIEPNPKTWEDLWGQGVLWGRSITPEMDAEAYIESWLGITP